MLPRYQYVVAVRNAKKSLKEQEKPRIIDPRTMSTLMDMGHALEFAITFCHFGTGPHQAARKSTVPAAVQQKKHSALDGLACELLCTGRARAAFDILELSGHQHCLCSAISEPCPTNLWVVC